MSIEAFFPKKSRCRRLQYDWITRYRGQFDSGTTLDLGGVRAADYHQILGLSPEQIQVWNADPNAGPDALVDLDSTALLPSLPANCRTILAFNLLEHLYRPLELLQWCTEKLPPGGQLVILVPFLYPIHPSPHDYWRMTPQLFERFFSETGVSGSLTVSPLGSDYREATAPGTSSMFKGGRLERVLATTLETGAKAASLVASTLGTPEAIKIFAEQHPSAIGVLWKKS